jgi:hypothetical protein
MLLSPSYQRNVHGYVGRFAYQGVLDQTPASTSCPALFRWNGVPSNLPQLLSMLIPRDGPTVDIPLIRRGKKHIYMCWIWCGKSAFQLHCFHGTEYTVEVWKKSFPNTYFSYIHIFDNWYLQHQIISHFIWTVFRPFYPVNNIWAFFVVISRSICKSSPRTSLSTQWKSGRSLSQILILVFSGKVRTFTDQQKDALQLIPSHRLLVETDSPYLGPPRVSINSPVYIVSVARLVAEVGGDDLPMLLV